MSSGLDETPAAARDPYASLDLDRQEGITTVAKDLPGGARHGGGGKFVLDDAERPADEVESKFDVGEYRNIPDGSAAQHARAAWYHYEDDLVSHPETGKQYAVLTREYEYPDEEDGVYAVTLRSSQFELGKGDGDDYSPFYEYDLTVRPLDDTGSIQWERTPPRSLNLTLRPQYEDLVYPDGTPFDPPHGEGTKVQVQTTWVDETEEFVERAAHLLASTLRYGFRNADLVDDSAAFSKAEVHHRVAEEVEGDVVHTLKQSADLLADHAADVETRGLYEDSRWLKCKIKTDGWEKLGFPDLDADVQIKLYYPDNPDGVDYPLDQPKLEVSLEGKETVVDEETGRTTERMIPWDRWSEVMTILEELLLSHLEWADVSPADLIADDYSDGANNPRTRWEHPQGRRQWLRKHYESLVPALYREATRTRTDLVLDILDVVRRYKSVTYEDLVDYTGAAYRTVREHVRRLCEEVGGDDAPGLLERDRGAVTLVSFSSRYLEDLSENAVDSVAAEKGETTADRGDRADERLETSLAERGLLEDDAEQLADAVRDERVYQRSDVRDADLDELERMADDLGLDVDLEPARSDDEDGTDDLEAGDEDDSDADTEPSSTSDDSPATWRPFDDVGLDADALGYALKSGSLEEQHVKVRTDPYPAIDGGGG